MTRRPGRLSPSRILWPSIYGGVLVLVAIHVMIIVGALP